ncbi:hypothetical protein D9619_002422 [Psilocybe cf. subviscida]|uniref:F-box domain-containing protein n=1 Tax=Psilocybe cf. subviscida TaxID=2480587 RepID=A0A8H5AW03_9AGAR|nr:hypothetical protein D9619_002422 [Psilocybe cf. subviscida]
MQDELERLKRETYDARVTHNQQHDPLIRIPPELMSSFFRFAIEFEYPTEDRVESYLMRSVICYIRPIQLASICTRWRRIALADPSLWSTIDITYRTENPEKCRKRWTPSLELIEQWISGSGALPLRIVLRWEGAPDSEDGTLGDIIKALCGQCHRWRSLHIQVPQKAMTFFQSARSEAIIDLEYLSIDHGDLAAHPMSVGQIILRPRHAYLWPSPLWVAGSYVWTNLVRLVISNANPYECVDIIQQAKQLETLRAVFFRTGEDGDALPPTEPVVAARLREMSIGFQTNGTLDELFSNIRAPELEVLELFRYQHIATHASLDFLTPMLFQPPTGNNLRKLSIGGFACSSEDLLRVLRELNKLSRFAMLYTRTEGTPPPLDDLLDDLATTSSAVEGAAHGAAFLHQLSNFSYTGLQNFSWSAIADVLHSHNTNTPTKRPLKSLTTLLVPSSVPEDYVDKETLLRLLALSPSAGTKQGIDEELFRGSFEHHGLDYPLHPLSIPGQMVAYPEPED